MPIEKKKKTTLLVILDGFGLTNFKDIGNAVTPKTAPSIFKYIKKYPSTTLKASGVDVGLRIGQVGNSEAGHFNIGAGRVVEQDLEIISRAIEDGTFLKNLAFKQALFHAKKYNSTVHIFGILTDGQSAHACPEHLYKLLEFFRKEKHKKIAIHLFTDGRDAPPNSAIEYLDDLKQHLKNGEKVASITGRFYAMDRNKIWERTEKAYNLIVSAEGDFVATSPENAIAGAYSRGETDEYIRPTIIVDKKGIPIAKVQDNDVVYFYNARSDRARQLTKAFVYDNLENIKSFSGQKVKTFARGSKPENLFFVTLTEYEKNLPVSAVAFKPQKVEMPLARVLSERNLYQLHIAETEKYAHVTYFFNGGHEAPYHGEDRILVDSPKVASYDLKPEMSATQVTKRLVDKINSRVYDFIVVNLANPDMVAHTGNFEATVKAVQAVDFHLGIIVQAALAKNGAVIITSDHGNAEELINQRTGQIDTEHNINPAPCIFVIRQFQGQNVQLPQGLLADVAPTILEILNITKPSQMTGRNLLK